MATRQQSLIVGIFEDRTRADQALAALQQAGFRPDQIEFAQHGATSGTGLLAELKSLFAGHDPAGDSVYTDLVRMGMPHEDARSYEREYAAGRSLIAVTDGNRLHEASAILTRYGAYGAPGRATHTTQQASPHKGAAYISQAQRSGGGSQSAQRGGDRATDDHRSHHARGSLP